MKGSLECVKDIEINEKSLNPQQRRFLLLCSKFDETRQTIYSKDYLQRSYWLN